MDGVKGSANNITLGQVFVMAASNLPWDLDVAVLRRLEKRVMVGLPVIEARESMLRKHLEDRSSSDLNFTQVNTLLELLKFKLTYFILNK